MTFFDALLSVLAPVVLGPPTIPVLVVMSYWSWDARNQLWFGGGAGYTSLMYGK